MEENPIIKRTTCPGDLGKFILNRKGQEMHIPKQVAEQPVTDTTSRGKTE